MLALKPNDERLRIAKLQELEILDTPHEAVFDQIVDLAASIFHVPTALISLVDEDRQWFKSKHGMARDETPRSQAFCAHAILGDQVMVVPDALNDARFRDNPLVTGGPKIRFYAGAPLVTPEGYRLGTVCVIDPVARDGITEEQAQQLNMLATVTFELMVARHAKGAADRRLSQMGSISQDGLLADIRDEVRAPMHGLMGLIALARRRVPDRDAGQLLDSAIESASLLRQLIDDLLDTAQMNAGILQLQFEVTHPSEILNAVVHNMRETAEQAGVSLEVRSTLAGVAFETDAARLRQVLIYFIGNAIKRCGSGAVCIDAGATGMVDNLVKLSFSIGDVSCSAGALAAPSGRETLPYVEDIGIGSVSELGLSISRRLVEMMGGDMGVKSVLGEGATFWFSLEGKGVMAESFGEGGDEIVTTESVNSSVTRVLIAEDNPMERLILEATVQALGGEPTCVANGSLAVQAVQTCHFDLILMGMQMPVMNGVEATRMIRALNAGMNSVTIVALTDANASQREMLKGFGFSDCLATPVLQNDLVVALRGFLPSKQSDELRHAC